MPAAWAASVEALKVANPAWQHTLYNKDGIEAFIIYHYGAEMLKRYNRIDPRYHAARSDLFRYLVVFAVGGVYLDVKSGAAIPLDDIVHPDDSFLLSKWRNGKGEVHEGFGSFGDVRRYPGGELQQWHVIAAAGHPLLAAVIERVIVNIDDHRPWSFGDGRAGVLRTTGPIVYTHVIEARKNQHPHRFAANEAELGLIYNTSGASSHGRADHYSALTAPVVLQSWHRALAYRFFRTAREATAKALGKR
jgi:mannosyltransferase OCH1-like enzyme